MNTAIEEFDRMRSLIGPENITFVDGTVLMNTAGFLLLCEKVISGEMSGNKASAEQFKSQIENL